MRALYASWIETHLGPLFALSTETALSSLSFTRFKQEVKSGKPDPLLMIEKELELYFQGKLTTFLTPYQFESGTPFQRRVWEELAKIPHGETRSYGEIALAIGNPNAYRAVGGANRVNPLAILIPCHRVINAGNRIGGYAGGLKWKKWLLHNEGTLLRER